MTFSAYVVLAIAVALSLPSAPAVAQARIADYPTKPIKFIVTYPPGGGNDTIARIIGQKIGESMGQTVVVENRSGAGGTIGTAAAAKSPPDGHTIVIVSPPFAMAPTLYPKLPYDTVKDLLPIAVIGSAPNVLVVHPDVPARTVGELLAYGRANPGKLAAATLGSATTQHLAAAMLAAMGKVEILLVPYKGSAPGMQDLQAGLVQLMFNAMPSTMPHVAAGRLRALAVTGKARLPFASELPTVAETLPGFEVVTWYGVLAPAGTPAPIIARLNREIVKALQLPDVKAKLTDMGVEIAASTPEAFAALIKSEIPRWAEVIRITGVKAE